MKGRARRRVGFWRREWVSLAACLAASAPGGGFDMVGEGFGGGGGGVLEGKSD